MEIVSLVSIFLLVLSEGIQVGLMILSKAALGDGMSNFVFIFYSKAFATFLFLPSALLFLRSSHRTTLTLLVLGGFFLLALLGCAVQFLGYAGIYYSSPTLCTAMLNLVPAFTFVLAISLRMEKYDCRSTISLLKTIGTIASLLRAFVVIFYDGPALTNTFLYSSRHPSLFSEHSNWVLGGLFLVTAAVLTSFSLILQAWILERCPGEMVMAFFYSFFVSILSAMVCLVTERDLGAWSLKSKTRLWSVLYSGSFGSVCQVLITIWCLKRTGPVFVTMFKPLGIVISIVSGVVFFDDTFYLGRLLGTTIIIAGFYSVLCAKSKEAKIKIESLESSTFRVPLLQNRIEEHKYISP